MISLDEYRTLLAAAGRVRRADKGRLQLRGADRLSYLQGLLTNDVQSLAAGQGRYAALLTAQGRMISDMRVFELGDRVIVDLEAALAQSIRDHFDRFVITEDVAVEDVTADLVQIGVYGPDSSRIVGQIGGESGATAPVVLPSDDLGVPGFDLLTPADRADALERSLEAAGAASVSLDVLDVTRVESGIPKFLVDMDTTTIPLEAGIEDRAISLTKGCYVGQEVIIRVLHRGGGRVAKKLVGIKPAREISRGDRVWSGEREIGVITSAVVSPRLGPIALGYVHREFTEPGISVAVRGGEGEVPARVSVLPFDVGPAQ